MRTKFLVYTPFTGLGLYGGFRGNRWLRNRITIFKNFVIPSLLNQTDRDFVHWISWRPEEKNNQYVKELAEYLNKIPNYRFVFTYEGICFWDDKYEDSIARDRLFNSLRLSLPMLFDYVPDCEEVIMLLQPSDDLYESRAIASIKQVLTSKEIQAVSYAKGYLCNYNTKEVLEYNPNTNPPFFAIRFPRDIFFDAGKHANYTGPYKSHEYIGEKLKVGYFQDRGFLVGTHGENVSTHFNHPFGGAKVDGILDQFGIGDAQTLSLPISTRKWLMRRLPYRVQRKLRYLFGELLYSRFYNWIRN